MTKELITKKFEAHRVRIVKKEDGVWFVAKDVCGVLKHSNHRRALSGLEIDEVTKCYLTDNLGREQNTSIVNESGLYYLIIKSRTPEARKFRRWVTSEVLPEIFRTGGYKYTATEKEPELSKKEYNKLLEKACAALRANISSGEVERLRRHHGWTSVEMTRVLWNTGRGKNNRIMQCLQEIALENKRKEIDSYNVAQLSGVVEELL